MSNPMNSIAIFKLCIFTLTLNILPLTSKALYKDSWTPENWCFWTVVFKTVMLLNCGDCGVGEDSWESLGLQVDPTSLSSRKSVLNIHGKDWCWSWNSNTSATCCKEPTHWKDPDSGKDFRWEEKGTTEDEMVGWHHQLHGHKFE